MNKIFAFVLAWVVASALFAQTKEGDRLANSAKVLQEILSADNGLPKSVLDRAACILIFPAVKKVAFGIGGSYGRGELVCRRGSQMNGDWGAPAMYKLDQGSLGLQVGSTETDLVLVVMSQKGVDEVLSGKVKLGSSAAAAAGPTGAQAASYTGGADILTYSRSKGLFAGLSLAGASIENDKDANKEVYGKEINDKDIVTGSQAVVPAAKPLVDLLNRTSPARS